MPITEITENPIRIARRLCIVHRKSEGNRLSHGEVALVEGNNFFGSVRISSAGSKVKARQKATSTPIAVYSPNSCKGGMLAVPSVAKPMQLVSAVRKVGRPISW